MASKKRVNVAKPGQAKKRPRLGQNFLRDTSAAQRIVEALGEIGDATVIEIGPGRGALTHALAARARRLIAIELDRVLAAQLRLEFARQRNVEIIEGDARTVDFANLIARHPAPLLNTGVQAADAIHERATVVGNLPYYITSEILLRLLDYSDWVKTIVIMVQREVADRIAASPGSRDYGLLSATVQLFALVEKLFTLPPAAFAPSPKVHSAVLRVTIAPRLHSLKVEKDGFVDFLKLVFAQKRKTLANNLRQRYPEAAIAKALANAGLRRDSRAEQLSLEKMAAVYRIIRQSL